MVAQMPTFGNVPGVVDRISDVNRPNRRCVPGRERLMAYMAASARPIRCVMSPAFVMRHEADYRQITPCRPPPARLDDVADAGLPGR